MAVTHRLAAHHVGTRQHRNDAAPRVVGVSTSLSAAIARLVTSEVPLVIRGLIVTDTPKLYNETVTIDLGFANTPEMLTFEVDTPYALDRMI